MLQKTKADDKQLDLIGKLARQKGYDLIGGEATGQAQARSAGTAILWRLSLKAKGSSVISSTHRRTAIQVETHAFG